MKANKDMVYNALDKVRGRISDEAKAAGVLDALVPRDGKISDTIRFKLNGTSYAAYFQPLDKTASGIRPVAFHIGCSCGDNEWCEHYKFFFERGYERMLFASRVRNDFDLMLPMYPSILFGCMISFGWLEDASCWEVSMRYEKNSKRTYFLRLGEFNIFTKTSHLVQAVESAVEGYYYADEVPFYAACKVCRRTPEDVYTPDSRTCILCVGKCARCLDHERVKLDMFAGTVPDLEGNDENIRPDLDSLAPPTAGGVARLMGITSDDAAARRALHG